MTTATLTPSPTPTESAAVTAAKSAYLAFAKEIFAGQRLPSKANFESMSKVATNPALSEVQRSILSLAVDGIAYRGDEPISHVTVVRDTSSATTPEITLADCPVSRTYWKPFSLSTGNPIAGVQGKAKAPYLTTVRLVHGSSSWLVTSLSTDRSRTCSP